MCCDEPLARTPAQVGSRFPHPSHQRRVLILLMPWVVQLRVAPLERRGGDAEPHPNLRHTQSMGLFMP